SGRYFRTRSIRSFAYAFKASVGSMWRNVTANCIEPSLICGVRRAYPRSRERITRSSTGFLREGRKSTRSSRCQVVQRRDDIGEESLGVVDDLVVPAGLAQPEPDDVQQRHAL